MNKIQNQASNDNFKTRKAYVSETREKEKAQNNQSYNTNAKGVFFNTCS